MANLSSIENASDTSFLPIWLIIFSVSLLTLHGQTGGAPSDPEVQDKSWLKAFSIPGRLPVLRIPGRLKSGMTATKPFNWR